MSNKIADLVNEIQFRLKLNKTQISERINYSRAHMHNAEKSDDDGNVYEALCREFGEILQNVKSLDNKTITKPGNLSMQISEKIEDALHNLTVSNSNLSVAFVKQAVAQEIEAKAREKEADARIIQASANKILVEVNRDTLNKIPNSNSTDSYQVASDSAVRVIDAMAKTLVRNGQYSNVEEATAYLDTLLTSDAEAKAFLGNQKKTDKSSRHKQT